MFDLLIRRARRRTTTVSVTQPLVAATVLGVDQQLAAALSAALAHPHPHLVLDLSAVRECDSAGATLLEAFRSVVEERGGRVDLAGTHPAVTKALAERSVVNVA